MSKRISCRAIIINNNNILVMHRYKKGREYYTYPGGGIEDNETLEDCVKREIKEELGINILPIRKVYEYEAEDRIEHFFLCEWTSGEFGTGRGEEMGGNNPSNVYEPMMININNLEKINILPGKISELVINDLKHYKTDLRPIIKKVIE